MAKVTVVRTKDSILVTNRQGQSFLCQGRNRVAKAARKARGTLVSGHPTKKHTKYRCDMYDGHSRVRKAKARLRHENLIFELYERAQ